MPTVTGQNVLSREVVTITYKNVGDIGEITYYNANDSVNTIQTVTVKGLENGIIRVKGQGNDDLEMTFEIISVQDGGSKDKALKRTAERVAVGKRSLVVYVGPRGGKYVKKDGKWVSVRSVAGKKA